MKIQDLPVVLAVSVTCVILASPVRADIYKYVDENGIVTYSDRAPKGSVRVKEVFPTQPVPPPSAAEAAAAAAFAAQQQALEMRLLAERVDRLTQAIEEQRSTRFAEVAAPVPDNMYAAPPWDYWPYYAPGYVVFGTPFADRFHRVNRFGHVNHFKGAIPGRVAPRGSVGVRGTGAVGARGGKTGFRMR